jgi:uncharacterized membrane protein YgcG
MPSPDIPRDSDGRAKVGVKFGYNTPREPLPLRDSLFLTYVEDLRMARGDAKSSILHYQAQIERFRTGDPAEIEQHVQRCYGHSTTIVQATEREEAGLEKAKEMLAEVEAAVAAHEQDLCHVFSAVPSPDQKYFPLALTRFVGLYGDEPTHVEWLIARAATEAEMDLCTPGQEGWGEDRRWRAGDTITSITVDPANLPVDYTVIDRGKISTTEQMVETSLYAAMKVAAVVKFHEREGNESQRAHWQHWLDRELSTLSQVSGVDYELDVSGRLPTKATVLRWEAEINVLDSEDQAKLRHWEAVCCFCYCDQEDDFDTEDAEWAEHLEREAEETRLWAQGKRERVLSYRSQLRGRRRMLSSLARRRTRSRDRHSRGRSVRRRGSRRATSRSAGGGSSGSDPGGGDPEPGEKPRPVTTTVLACVLAFVGFLGAGAMTPSGVASDLEAPYGDERVVVPLSPYEAHRAGIADFERMVDDFRRSIARHGGFRLNLGDLEVVAGMVGEVEDCGMASVVGYLSDGLDDGPSLEMHAEMMATGLEITERDLTLLQEVRHLGPTPELLKRAQHALVSPDRCESRTMERHRSRPAVLLRRRGCSRARSSRGSSSARTRGSRRVNSRSAGGGSSGDDPGGSDDPPGGGQQLGAVRLLVGGRQ